MTGDRETRRMEAWRQLLRAHARLVERVEREMAAAGVIPLDWYDILAALACAPEQRLRMGELANAMMLNRSSLTRLADRLESAGYLRRAPTPGDRRGAFAVLTEAGDEALRAAAPVYRRTVAAAFGDRLSDALTETLMNVFSDIAARLDAETTERRRSDGHSAAPTGSAS